MSTEYPQAGVSPCDYCEQTSVAVVNGRAACVEHVDQAFGDVLAPIRDLLQ